MPSSLATNVRTYSLFGELGDLPDVVHCETIAARSQVNDWELASHRHARLHQVLLLAGDGGRAVLDGRPIDLTAKSAVNVPIGSIHSFSFTPGTQGWVVTIAAEMLEAALGEAEDVRQVLKRPGSFASDAALRAVIERLFSEYAARDFGRAQMLRALCGELLGQVARALPRSGDSAARTNVLFRRFEALLDARVAERHSVADYAAALGISPVHLSRIARAATGKPASWLIEERLIREARRNLIYTNLSVATIAYTLGFSDPAYFSRIFTRATGLAPRRFRERVLRGS